MKTLKNYNIFIFISTFTRNIIDIYSIVYLYQKGIILKDIILIYALIYFLGVFISTLSIKIGSKLGYKYILIISTIITSITFYIINNINNIYLISLFLSLSIFTYHPIKHYYGMNILKNKKNIGNTLILTYIATILSSYIVINNLKTIYLIIIQIISIIPALFIKKEINKENNKIPKLKKNKLNFFILDQFKLIFILLQPLYLYIISRKVLYIGIFNIVLTISSVIYTYVIANKIDIEKKYKYINIIFCIILILKLNIINKTLLLVLAFIEGIGIKSNELISTINLYSVDNPNKEYIITTEKIFCLAKTIILCIIYFILPHFKIAMYFLIIGIFFLSFQYKKDTI